MVSVKKKSKKKKLPQAVSVISEEGAPIKPPPALEEYRARESNIRGLRKAKRDSFETDDVLDEDFIAKARPSADLHSQAQKPSSVQACLEMLKEVKKMQEADTNHAPVPAVPGKISAVPSRSDMAPKNTDDSPESRQGRKRSLTDAAFMESNVVVVDVFRNGRPPKQKRRKTVGNGADDKVQFDDEDFTCLQNVPESNRKRLFFIAKLKEYVAPHSPIVEYLGRIDLRKVDNLLKLQPVFLSLDQQPFGGNSANVHRVSDNMPSFGRTEKSTPSQLGIDGGVSSRRHTTPMPLTRESVKSFAFTFPVQSSCTHTSPHVTNGQQSDKCASQPESSSSYSSPSLDEVASSDEEEVQVVAKKGMFDFLGALKIKTMLAFATQHQILTTEDRSHLLFFSKISHGLHRFGDYQTTIRVDGDKNQRAYAQVCIGDQYIRRCILLKLSNSIKLLNNASLSHIISSMRVPSCCRYLGVSMESLPSLVGNPDEYEELTLAVAAATTPTPSSLVPPKKLVAALSARRNRQRYHSLIRAEPVPSVKERFDSRKETLQVKAREMAVEHNQLDPHTDITDDMDRFMDSCDNDIRLAFLQKRAEVSKSRDALFGARFSLEEMFERDVRGEASPREKEDTIETSLYGASGKLVFRKQFLNNILAKDCLQSLNLNEPHTVQIFGGIDLITEPPALDTHRPSAGERSLRDSLVSIPSASPDRYSRSPEYTALRGKGARHGGMWTLDELENIPLTPMTYTHRVSLGSLNQENVPPRLQEETAKSSVKKDRSNHLYNRGDTPVPAGK